MSFICNAGDNIVDNDFVDSYFGQISLDNFTSGRLHTLITSAFSHIDIGHIVSNMIGLYFFGTSVTLLFSYDLYLLSEALPVTASFLKSFDRDSELFSLIAYFFIFRNPSFARSLETLALSSF